jgi:beta-xylosidase
MDAKPFHLLPHSTRGPIAALLVAGALFPSRAPAANPAITDVLTADPAAMVHEGRVYLYTGHDEAPAEKNGYVMTQWLCFSSTDMVNWKAHGSPLAVTDFKWAKGDAWAGHVIPRDGKFYWYVPMSHATIPGFAIGVAASDSPTGPFKDARGSALITNDMTTDVSIAWDDIDPAVFIDDDGQAYLFWGNSRCRYVKLKANMIEIDGPIHTVDVPGFTEASWVHKHKGLYYFSYAYGFPEKTAYATSTSVTGPWTFRGILNELSGNCNTNHQAIIEFKGRSYFIYHNGGTPQGGSFRRSVCIDYLDYNADGTIKRIVQTSEGVSPATGP